MKVCVVPKRIGLDRVRMPGPQGVDDNDKVDREATEDAFAIEAFAYAASERGDLAGVGAIGGEPAAEERQSVGAAQHLVGYEVIFPRTLCPSWVAGARSSVGQATGKPPLASVHPPRCVRYQRKRDPHPPWKKESAGTPLASRWRTALDVSTRSSGGRDRGEHGRARATPSSE